MKRLHTFSIGEYESEDQAMMERITKYIETYSINKSKFIRNALKHYEETVLKTNLNYKELHDRKQN